MLQELVAAPGESTGPELHEAYLDALREHLPDADRESVPADEAALDALAAGDRPDLSLSAAAAIAAAAEGFPDAEAVEAEALDHLLLGMTTAVLDVDTIAANLDLDLSPTEVQQRLEGRNPMTLAEYAHVHALVERRKP
jgi:hypothetical protein